MRPQRQRSHGERVTYMFGFTGSDLRNGCRCDDCRRANTEYQRTAPRSVDAGRIADHLEVLAVNGIGNRAMYRRTGIQTSVLHRIRVGTTKRVHKATADKILAVKVRPDIEDRPIPFRDPLPKPAAFVPVGWQADAACRDSDPAIFFPGRGESTEPAKSICRTCPVSDACLEYSIEVGLKHGIYGGLSERERRRLRRDRRRAAAEETAA